MKNYIIKINFFILLNVIFLIQTPTNLYSQSIPEINSSAKFEENKGQIGDADQKLHPEVFFKSTFNDVTMFFKKDGIVYLFNKFETVQSDESIKERNKGNYARAKELETKPMIFRMDLLFLNTNPEVEIIPENKREEISNFYLAHCPNGVFNVNNYNKITYKNIYPNIDITYFFTDKGLKYDIIVHPGGKISDISFKYEGASNIFIDNKNQLNIIYADNQKLIEEKPLAYFEEQINNEQKIVYQVNPKTGIISFIGKNDTFIKTLIIDPAISWSTYFRGSSSSGYPNAEYDSNGNLFTTTGTYDASFPTINPGGSAYYDGSKTTMIKVAILKFNTNRALEWSTYYGGNQYCTLPLDYGKCLALDNSGNVYVTGYTDVGTTIFPTYNPGGGAFYQDQSRCFGSTSFFLKFNNSGVRQWATMFQHEQANTSSNAIKVNGITCDGTNLYFTGETYNWTPANTVPLRNPGGGAHYQSTILGDQDVFVGRFITSTNVLNWCTYLHTNTGGMTAYGQGLDVHCDASGNLFLVGRESGANSHHYLVNLAGSYYQGTKGAGNSDLFITKFNTSLTAVWGTYYGGNGQDIPSTIEPDGLGNMYFIGRATPSTDFPVLNPGGGALYQGTKSNAASDGFLIRFNASTCARNWATYIGANVPSAGSDENHFSGIAINSSNNNVFLSGYTKSTLMTAVNKAGSYNQATNAGDYDRFFYELNSSGVVQWASYFGGANSETFYNGRLALKIGSCGPVLFTITNTTTQTLSTVNPGGGAWYQNTTPNTNNDFIVEFSDAAAPLPVSVTISASANPICSGTNVTFTATPTNGGTPTYQWYLNGSPVGSNSSTYSNSGLSNGNTVYCVINSSLSCVSGNPATSNTVTITVNPNVAAGISIAASSNPICAGTNVTFTATPTNGGTPTYQWYLNGSPVGSNSSTYSNSGLSNGNTVYCVMTSTATCVTGSPVTSNTVSMSVNPNLPASISIAASSNPICAGTNVTFTATPTNGGTPTYQWYLNGSPVGSNSSTYSNSGLSNGNTVYCVMTSTATCVTGSPATSNTVSMTVNPNLPASISIAASANPICAGTNVTFTATPTNGGTPTYQWYVNGSPVGSNSSTYSNSSLTNGNTVYCVMTSTATCVSGSPATSNTVTMTVNTNLPASISISASANPICSGTNVTFTATPTNGGTPTYQWYLNGSPVGSNSSTYSNSGLSNGNTVYCVMTSTATCVTGSPATSNTVTMNVSSNLTASASIAASSNPVCSGTNVTFTATPTNGGTPTYQWYLNGSPIGSNSSTYSNSGLANGNTIYCVMISSETCATGSPATSSTITMTINATSTDPSSASATNATICAGSSTTLNVNGGSLGLGANWAWYNGGCGSGVSIGSGNSITVSPTSTSVYYVRAEGTCNNTACVSVVVNVTSAANAGSNGTVSVCQNAPVINLFTQLGGTPSGGGTWTNSLGNTVTNLFDPSTQLSEIFTYTVTGTAPCGNATSTVSVTVNPLPIVSFTGLDAYYCGVSDPTHLTGNHAPFGSFTGVNINDHNDGTAGYTHTTIGTHNITYTYTDANGCTASDVQTVSVYPLPSVSFVGLAPSYCAGLPSVNIIGNHAPNGTFTGTGSTDNGNGSGSFNPAIPGISNIIYTYTDGNGCTASDVQQVEIFENPSVNSIAITDVTVCSAPYNGEINISATGGLIPYEYAFNSGAFSSNNIFTALNVGGYTISIKDGNGCTIDTLVTINSNTGFNIDSVSVTNILCNGNTTGQIVIHALNGVNYSINNGTTYLPTNTFNNLSAGSYNVMAQDIGLCSDIFIVNISEPTLLTLDTIVINEICGGNNGSAEIVANGGTSNYTYSWSNSTNTALINNMPAGTYFATVTDANGCSTTTSAIIGNNGGTLSTSVSQTNLLCNGNTNGSATITVSGSGTYTYLWSNLMTTSTITGLSAGDYFVTVADGSGCQGLDTVHITEPLPLSYSGLIYDVSCYGLINGSIDINASGGTAGYTYTWAPTGYTISGDTYSGLPAGTYNFTITDVNGCVFTSPTINIIEPTVLSINTTGNSPTCYGQNNGIGISNATGGVLPYVYLWSNSTQGSSVSNLSAGVFYVTVTDAHFCIATDTLTLQAPTQISYIDTVQDASCIGNNDGLITLSISGGNSPYTYFWNTNPVQTTSDISGLIAGTYLITITDNNNCQITETFDIKDGTTTCLRIPTLFTPNADGINDNWVIEGIELYPNCEIEIFNRWGDVIFKSTGYNVPWDGTYKNQVLDISSYVFILKLGDGSEPINGIVTIKK